MSMRHGPNIQIAFLGLKRNNGHSHGHEDGSLPDLGQSLFIYHQRESIDNLCKRDGYKYL